MKFEELYSQFEKVFRGSEKLIRARLDTYLPLLQGLPLELKEHTIAVDLGCGRGEWLRLAKDQGWKAIGVDTNSSMAAEAEQHGLIVHRRDALDFLKEQPANSVGLMSCFQVVEHLPFEYLCELISEIERVLANNGLLILETPNAENLTVGTDSFYLDPTHVKPIPSRLLNFLVQHAGIRDSAIVRLNGDLQALSGGAFENALGLLLCSGLDYAIVAQKHKQPSTGYEPSLVQPFAERVSQPNPGDVEKVLEVSRRADRQLAEIDRRLGMIEQQEIQSFVGAAEALLNAPKALSGEAETSIRSLLEFFTSSVRALANANQSLLGDLESTQGLVARLGEVQALKADIAELHASMTGQVATAAAYAKAHHEQSIRLEKAIQTTQGAIQALHQATAALKANEDASTRQVTLLNMEISTIKASTSWRITAPFRLGVLALRKLLGRLSGRPPAARVEAGPEMVNQTQSEPACAQNATDEKSDADEDLSGDAKDVYRQLAQEVDRRTTTKIGVRDRYDESCD